MSVAEKRTLPRIPVHLAVRIDIILVDQMRRHIVLEAHLHDMHEQGCRAEARLSSDVCDMLKKGKYEAEIDFRGRQGLPEKVYARNVWLAEKQDGKGRHVKMGFQFAECPATHADAIRQFLEHSEMLYDVD